MGSMRARTISHTVWVLAVLPAAPTRTGTATAGLLIPATSLRGRLIRGGRTICSSCWIRLAFQTPTQLFSRSSLMATNTFALMRSMLRRLMVVRHGTGRSHRVERTHSSALTRTTLRCGQDDSLQEFELRILQGTEDRLNDNDVYAQAWSCVARRCDHELYAVR